MWNTTVSRSEKMEKNSDPLSRSEKMKKNSDPPLDDDFLYNTALGQGGVRWFCGNGSQNRMFAEADNKGHQFFVARNYSYENGRWGRGYEYASFQTAKHWKDNGFSKSGVHYEVIRKHSQLYIDVDQQNNVQKMHRQ